MSKKAAILERRTKRFQATREALERLLQLTRMERKLMMKRLLGWAPGEEMLFANCAGMPAVGCDTWLSSLLCIPDEGAIQKAADPDQDDTDTDSDSSGPEAPATEPMEPAPRRSGFPRKRKFSDELAFGSGADRTDDVDLGIDAVLKLQGDCAAFMVPVSGGADLSSKVLHACEGEGGVVHMDAGAESAEESDSSGSGPCSDNDDVDSCAAQVPAVGGDTAKRRDWVVKKVDNSAVHVVRRDVYDQRTNQMLARRMLTRPMFLNHIDTVFGRVLLESSQVTETQQRSLHALYAEFNGKLWGRPVGDIPRAVHQNPPAEIYLPLAWDAYVAQYRIFRKWIYSFMDTPWKGEFFHVEGYHIKKVRRDAPSDDRAWYVTTRDVVEAGRWQHHIPRPGSEATSRLHGKVVVVDTVTRPILTRVYKHIMRTSLAEVRGLGIWHAVVSMHRSIHMDRSSEALAETVGSIMGQLQNKWQSGGRVHISHLVSSAAIRMAGVRGLGGEDGILSTALNMHFACPTPQG